MLYLIMNKLYINRVNQQISSQWAYCRLYWYKSFLSEMLLTLLNIARQPTVGYQQSIQVFDQYHFKEKQQIFQSKVLDFVIHCHVKEQSHFNPLILIAIVSISFNSFLENRIHIFTEPNKKKLSNAVFNYE